MPDVVRTVLGEARLDVIDGIAGVARANGAEHVLVAGDVFDNPEPGDRLLRQALSRMRDAGCILCREADKHFRSYQELISYSSATFYGGQLQAIKIRGVSLEDVIRFDQVEADPEKAGRGTNEAEAEFILERLLDLLDEDEPPTVGVITPFREQQTLLTKKLFGHARGNEMQDQHVDDARDHPPIIDPTCPGLVLRQVRLDRRPRRIRQPEQRSRHARASIKQRLPESAHRHRIKLLIGFEP
jgi:hypothetical protein